MKKLCLLVILSFLITGARTFAQDWNYVNDSGTSFILFGMSFPPAQSTVGYACGMQYTYDAPGVVVKTTDGGINWTQILPVSGDIDGLQGIWFIDDNTGFASGWNNYFIKTTDGGNNWSPVTVGSGVWYYVDVVFWDSNNGVAAATMDSPGNQAIFITSDGGNTWSPASSGAGTNAIMGLSYGDQNTVFAVCTDGKVLKSTDGGNNWSEKNTLSAMLFGVDFADANFGVAGGEEKMFATNDGGSTWTTYTTGYENFCATKAFSNGTAYVGGTDENIYKTTDYGNSWSLEHDGSGSATLYRIRFTLDGTGFACGSQGTILINVPPLSADFTSDITTVCEGGDVHFTDLSTGTIDTWEWTFEGGTPATSFEQNPTVTYSNPGVFDVTLVISSGAIIDTELKSNYITVVSPLTQPSTPTGMAEVCNGDIAEYITDPLSEAESYDWEIAPSEAGSIAGNGTTGTFTASTSWTGSFTVSVRAQNTCGYGPWSDPLTCEVMAAPSPFFLTGEGEYCEGSSGTELILEGSETGFEYELYLDDVSTGIIEAGTGSPINFGYFTEEGFYTVIGFSGSCSVDMYGSIWVHMVNMPGQAAAPEGPATVCNDTSTMYTTAGTPDASSYTWTLSPGNAGTLTPDLLDAEVDWNPEFSGIVYLKVQGENECGEGAVSDSLEISVNDTPDPMISGQDLVCEDDMSEYQTEDHAGATYSWEVIGGTIEYGAGTHLISVHWGSFGTGYVIVTEENEFGCSTTTDAFEVTIDECTRIEEITGNDFIVFPNPVKSTLNMKMKNDQIEIEEVVIYNVLGTEMLRLEQDLAGQISINTDDWGCGIYFIRVKASGTFIILKFEKID